MSSTDFKVADQKLSQIIDKSKDVDPDLRFMALNDLNKLLIEHKIIINNVNSYSFRIIKILIDSLNDSNSDVQNQSLKCFEPLVSSLDDDEILTILAELRNNKTQSNSITTSIQTMASAEILKNLNLKNSKTGALIGEELLPSIISEGDELIKSLDSIETLTDLIKYLGKTFPHEETVKIYKSLANTIFKGEPIISKKSIIAVGLLVSSLSQEDFRDLLQLIASYAETDDYDIAHLSLVTYISLAKSNNTLFAPFVDDFMKYSFKHLYLDQEELDDDQIKIDETRYESLQFIDTLIPLGDEISSYVDDIFSIVKKFLIYDPYTANYSDDEVSNDSADEFSDEDEYDDDPEDESDDNTWKLRKQSAKLVTSLVREFPSSLSQIFSTGIFESLIDSLSDSSETVSFEKTNALNVITSITLKQHGKRSSRKRRGSGDVAMADTDDSLTTLIKLRDKIVSKFIKELSSIKFNNLNKYNNFLRFFQNFNRLDGDLKPLLVCVRKHNYGLNLDLLNFYSCVLQRNDLQYFGDEIAYIIEIVNGGLTSKNHISVLNSIDTAVDLLNLIYNEALIKSIVDIASSSKNDSEIRNTAIQKLGELKTLPGISVNEILSLFSSTLIYEPIAQSTISSVSKLTETYHSTIEHTIINEIVDVYTRILSDPNYSSYVIDSLGVIVCYFEIDPTSVGLKLFEIFNDNRYQSQILRVLSHLNFDKLTLIKIFTKAITVDEIDDESLIKISRKIGSQLIPILENSKDDIRAIKSLADIVITENLTSYIQARENDLINGVEPAFNIRLLGFIGQKMPIGLITDQLAAYFDDDETKIFAAQALGKIVSKNVKEYLNVFLSKIKANEHRYLLLIAIKQVLKIDNGLKFEDYNGIWNTVIDVIQEESELNEELAKISAQDIGLILVNNDDTNFFYNKAIELLDSKSEPIVYTTIAAVKFILAYDNIISIELIESMLLHVFKKIPSEDLKTKQISVITLITALNNQFNLLIPYLPTILPIIYNELATKKQYQETIQIGPFKHKVDKALEVRKNAFEILYKLSLNHAVLPNVDFNEILAIVVKDGLNKDIVSISSLIIIKLLEIDNVSLDVESKQSLVNGIDKLLGSIKKKEDQQKDSKEEQETKTTLINLRNSII